MDAIIDFVLCLFGVGLVLAVLLALVTAFDYLLRDPGEESSDGDTAASNMPEEGALGHYMGCLSSLITHLERERERS